MKADDLFVSSKRVPFPFRFVCTSKSGRSWYGLAKLGLKFRLFWLPLGWDYLMPTRSFQTLQTTSENPAKPLEILQNPKVQDTTHHRQPLSAPSSPDQMIWSKRLHLRTLTVALVPE